MKPIIFLIAAMVLSAGCIQSPATVAKEMPSFWDNATKNVNNVTGPVVDSLPELTLGNNTDMPTNESIVLVVKL